MPTPVLAAGVTRIPAPLGVGRPPADSIRQWHPERARVLGYPAPSRDYRARSRSTPATKEPDGPPSTALAEPISSCPGGRPPLDASAGDERDCWTAGYRGLAEPRQAAARYAKIQGARRILEIGTLGGYSTIWLARALARRQRHSLEFDPKHADVARANIGTQDSAAWCRSAWRCARHAAAAGAEGRGPFDLIFIDADKVNTPLYFTWALTLSRPGSLIIVDNVVRDGAVADSTSTDVGVQGMRHFFDLVRAEPRVEATAIQTVGIKGYDGLAIVRVLDGIK